MIPTAEAAQGLYWYCKDFEDEDTLEVLRTLWYEPVEGETHNTTLGACNVYDYLISGGDLEIAAEEIQRCLFLTLSNVELDLSVKHARSVVVI